MANGIYGPIGWTSMKKIKPLIKQFIEPSPYNDPTKTETTFGSYERFTGLDAETATKLKDLLPEENLKERQNEAPTAETLLDICINNPKHVKLMGYAIGPCRTDERISLEGFFISTEALDPVISSINFAAQSDYDQWLDAMWNDITGRMEIHPFQPLPDELTFTENSKYIRCWWD